MQANDTENYSTFYFKNLNISKMKRAFKMKQNAFFIVFEGLSFGIKIKIADTSFNPSYILNFQQLST